MSRFGIWEWSPKEKDCLIITVYFHPEEIRCGFSLSIFGRFRFQLELWLIDIILSWKDMTVAEMMEALHIQPPDKVKE